MGIQQVINELGIRTEGDFVQSSGRRAFNALAAVRGSEDQSWNASLLVERPHALITRQVSAYAAQPPSLVAALQQVGVTAALADRGLIPDYQLREAAEDVRFHLQNWLRSSYAAFVAAAWEERVTCAEWVQALTTQSLKGYTAVGLEASSRISNFPLTFNRGDHVVAVSYENSGCTYAAWEVEIIGEPYDLHTGPSHVERHAWIREIRALTPGRTSYTTVRSAIAKADLPAFMISD